MKFKSNKILKNRIFKSDWHKNRPMGIISPSDDYYVQLSNKILSIIDNSSDKDIFDEKIKRIIAVNIAAYFEDVISGFGLWRAFVKLYNDMYGKFLPFYEIYDDEYFEDEINMFDVLFLLWCFLQRNEIDNEVSRFLNPENPVLTFLAFEIFSLLDNEYETAPENESINKYIHVIDHSNDFISARELLYWLHYDCYLSMSYPKQDLNKQLEMLEDRKTDKFYRENEDLLKYSFEKALIFTSTCSPLALHAKDWMAQILAGTPKEEGFKSIVFKQIDNYHIIDSGAETFTIINAERDKFIVSLDSLNNPPSMKKENFIMCALVFFNGLWHVNGFASFASDNRELVSTNDKSKLMDNNKKTYDYVLKTTKKPIRYFADAHELKIIMKQLFPETDENKFIPVNFKNAKNFVLFVHPEIGLSFYPDLALHINDSNNPYYNKEIVEMEGLQVLSGLYELPKQLIEYLIDNNLLKDIALNSLHGREYGNKQVQENLRFIVRFFQPDLYN